MSCFHSSEGENSTGKWDRRPIIGQLADIKIQAGMRPMLQVTCQQKQREWGRGKHRRKKQEREMVVQIGSKGRCLRADPLL